MVSTRSVSTRSAKSAPGSVAKQTKPSGKKVKNKVASPIARKIIHPSPLRNEEVESDEFDYGEEDEPSVEEVEAVQPEHQDSVHSDSESTSSRQQLPRNLQRQLLIDIQVRGGIDKFGLDSQQSLSNLCDQRPILYGPRGDKLRGRIGKKVIRWRNLHRRDPIKFLAVLTKFSVAEKPAPSSAKKRVPKSNVSPIADKDINQSEEEEKKPPARKSPHFPIPSTVSVVSRPPSVHSLPSAKAKVAKMSTESNTQTIMVNPTNPEANGPVLIYDVPDMPGSDNASEYKGFYIILPIDNRFVEIDDTIVWYKANVIGEKLILFRVPAWPYALWPNSQYSRNFYDIILNQVGLPIQKSMNACHSVFDAESDAAGTATVESRKWKYIMLDFSNVKGCGELSSSKVYSEAGEVEAMDYDFIQVPQYFEKDNKGNLNVTHNEEFLGFKVAHTPPAGEGGRKTARATAKKSKLALKREEAAARAAAKAPKGIRQPVASVPIMPQQVPSWVPQQVPSWAPPVPLPVASTPVPAPASGKARREEKKAKKAEKKAKKKATSLQLASVNEKKMIGQMKDTNIAENDSEMEEDGDGSDSSTDELLFGKIDEVERDIKKGKDEFETMDTSTPGENKRTRDKANAPVQKGGIVPSIQFTNFLSRK